ncbi:MAG TPA: hypothetical protein VEP92_11530 [Gaiellaceae bacterium]|jgi:hypothetical protein|nr:hypothetical protein [Gaiellaceae bacterium]
MKRFLTLLAVAAIAGVMYVTAAPGGLRSAGPTAKQFKALKASVTKLQKQLKTVKTEAEAGLAIEELCIMHAPVGVSQLGTSSSGYLFGPPQTTPTASTASATSALDLAPSSPQYRLLALNTSQADCVTLANTASTHAAARAVGALSAGH